MLLRKSVVHVEKFRAEFGIFNFKRCGKFEQRDLICAADKCCRASRKLFDESGEQFILKVGEIVKTVDNQRPAE